MEGVHTVGDGLYRHIRACITRQPAVPQYGGTGFPTV